MGICLLDSTALWTPLIDPGLDSWLTLGKSGRFHKVEFCMETWDWQFEGKALIVESWKKCSHICIVGSAQYLPGPCLSWNLAAQFPLKSFGNLRIKFGNLPNKIFFVLKVSWIAFVQPKGSWGEWWWLDARLKSPEAEIKWTGWGMGSSWGSGVWAAPGKLGQWVLGTLGRTRSRRHL